MPITSAVALYTMRSPILARLYLQCPPDDDIESWPDAHLAGTAHADRGARRRRPHAAKGITAMRSFVVEPMQHGRMFLAGDSARIQPPTGAKGMNLALADVLVLSRGITAFYRSAGPICSNAVRQPACDGSGRRSAFLVDDAVVSSRPQSQCLRPQAPACGARLRDELGSRGALARRELRRASGRGVEGAGHRDAGRGGRRGCGRACGGAGGSVGRARRHCRGSRLHHRHRDILAQQRGHPCRSVLSDRLLRAGHCTRSRRMLYEYCASHGVPHRKCGKLVVATSDSEIARLEAVYKQARTSEVEGIDIIDGVAARRLEPEPPVSPRCTRRKPASSTAISSCWHCAATLRITAVSLRSTRRSRCPAKARLGGAVRRRRSPADPRRCRDQLCRSRRPAAGAHDRRLSVRAGATARARQRQLFQVRGSAGIHAAHLSGAGTGRAGRACDARPRRANTIRAGRGGGSSARATTSTPLALTPSTVRSAIIGRDCPTARSRQTTPESGRS